VRPPARRRRLAAAVLVGALGLLTAAPAASQAASGGSDSQSTVSLLRLLDRTPWVGDGFDFELSVQVLATPAGSELQMTVHDRVRSRSEFARSLTGEGLRRRLSGPAPVPVEQLDADGDGTIPLLVPLVDREGVTPVSLAPGVYPVVVELVGPDGTVLDELDTHLVRLPALDPESTAVPLSVAVVIALQAPPVDLDAGIPAPSGGPIEQVTNLTAVLAAHPDVTVNVVTGPESIAAVAAEDHDAVVALRSALGSSEVFDAPWVTLDEAAWARADDGQLTSLLARGRRALTTHLATSPSRTRLLPDEGGLAHAASMVEHGAEALVVNEADLAALDDGDFPYTLARPFDLAVSESGDDEPPDTVAALASDRDLAAIATTADDDPLLAAHQILADLAVIAADEPESARVATLVLPQVAAMSPGFLDTLLSGLEAPPAPPLPAAVPADPNADPEAPPPAPPAPIPAAAPRLVGATITEALAAVEPAGAEGGSDTEDRLLRRLTAETPNVDVTRAARLLRDAQADLASLRTVFGPADASATRIETVLATAAASSLAGEARADALASVDRVIAGRLGALHAPERQRVRLTARQGRVQLVLTNDAGDPADVMLVLRGDRLVFPDAPDGRLPVRLGGGTTRVNLQVEARSSGDAPLDIVLTSPDGRLQLGESRITVRTTAFSGVGIALMAAALAFLGLWWTRTILRERRTTRQRHPSHMRRG